MRLLGFRDAELRLRHDFLSEQGSDLPQLAGIIRGKHQLHAPSDFFWCWTSSPMPFAASSSSVSSSAREKSAPSAVPCTSMKLPEPVITTFMSQPQAESSL